ncbi:facilitated trehalose transporter Tret1-like isoform X2 [Anthonomus grandis grandis]|uniref:facilitated trehalose transporter Tret1-like isoform X1 n=1 Tax=Anthonomus grandis grandis TaxID=2921223 RepID=UPI002164F56E|nr:facilitated trehalose transporter Tret1-like isoform X1 [Anthonomus grandis grandis]XP_050303556.1 facilitated trehalose transporter Tret1-like isoform X2 [Anthonomus grandis grandis]
MTVRLINYNREYIFQYFATIAGVFSILCSGINLGWTSPFLPELLSPNSTIPTTNDEGSWCAVAPLLGAPPGAIIAALLVDKIGRKYTILLIGPWVSICFIGIAFSTSIWEITGLRFIIGSTEGALYTVLPMYIGEISDPKIREFLTATIAIAAITGTLFINVIGSFFSIFVSSLLCAVLPLIHMVGFWLVPESPYYYTKKGNFQAAKESLQILRGKQDVDQEMDAIAKAVVRQERTSDQTGLLDLFTVSSNRRACFIFIIVCMTNKFSGKNPCMFYTETIFKEASSSIDATLSVIIYCTVELVAVVIATFFVVNRFGKRMLLILSAAGCSLAVLALAIFFFLKDYGYNTELFFWLPITALVTYNIMFSIGLSFGMVTVLSELFPTNVKAKALCIADTFSVLMGTLVSKIFQIFYDQTGSMSYPFLFFSFCSFIGCILIVRNMPETKGKTLEEIQQLLIGQEQYSSELRVRHVAYVNNSFI